MDALKTLSMEKQIRTYCREIPDKLAKKSIRKMLIAMNVG